MCVIFIFYSMTVFASPKIGYINMAQIMSSQQIIEIGRKLQNEFKPRNMELEKFKKQVADKQSALEHDSPTLSTKEYNARLHELNRLKLEVEKRQIKQHEDFESRKQEELLMFQNAINVIINNIGKSEGFDLILYNDAVYSNNKVEITDKVLKTIK